MLNILKVLTKAANFFCLILLLYRGMAVFTSNAAIGGVTTTTCTGTGGTTVTTTRQLKHNPILKYLHPPP